MTLNQSKDQLGCLYTVTGVLSEDAGTVNVNVWFETEDLGQDEMDNYCDKIYPSVDEAARMLLPKHLFIDDQLECLRRCDKVAKNDPCVAVVVEGDACTIASATEKSVTLRYNKGALSPLPDIMSP